MNSIWITPKIPYKPDVQNIELPEGMLDFAARRCQARMQELVEGKPLTDVVVKAYLQGFFDAAKAGGLISGV